MSKKIVAPDRYCGRFAPTPSGPLHLGSLKTATASWLQARRQDGVWLLRIDDLDQARCPIGMDAVILRQLEACGLTWDMSVWYQREHLASYRAARDALWDQDQLFRCDCTRAALRARGIDGNQGSYDGHCLNHPPGDTALTALRFRWRTGTLAFEDGAAGRQQTTAAALDGFVVWRRDGIPGYALCCAVDEAAMRITEVVRGDDLLHETFSQCAVMAALNLPRPRYQHLPVMLDDHGRKLSKQNHATPIGDSAAAAATAMTTVLRQLGLPPPSAVATAPPVEQLQWALSQSDPTVHRSGASGAGADLA
ncbi:tRNA glutamyl-Q(34) synthetase GluQRS [Flagellatimonas centrodinii]|uniref:tRNA glutamyl-Q(34) synthetase GluQRS n=1 Tax=Flagellatimonas centrodinii TaxID=2806210 RepID=UPI001FEE2B5B|nr:tRNA glutamyl-Q(34) synthetase GluQRS [Flagellatimonas centrodinii]ULQ45901.1 tRNA glutamyl-Q(34) synthetase GluQRS [Flagellatimonas centrodinii]